MPMFAAADIADGTLTIDELKSLANDFDQLNKDLKELQTIKAQCGEGSC